jgi:hypothetical protein
LAAEVKNEPQVRRLFDLAMKLEACRAQLDPCRRRSDRRPPAAGAGAASPRSALDMPVTQFDMKYVEARGW